MVSLARKHPIKFIAILLGLTALFAVMATNYVSRQAKGQAAPAPAAYIHVDTPVSVATGRQFNVKVAIADSSGRPITNLEYGQQAGQYFLPSGAIKNAAGKTVAFTIDTVNVHEVKAKDNLAGTGVYIIPVTVNSWPGTGADETYMIEARYISQAAGSANDALNLSACATFVANGEGKPGVIRWAPLYLMKTTLKAPQADLGDQNPKPINNSVIVRVKPTAQVRDSKTGNRRVSGLAAPAALGSWIAPVAVDNTGKALNVKYGAIKEVTTDFTAGNTNRSISTGVYDVELIVETGAEMAGRTALLRFGLNNGGAVMNLTASLSFSVQGEIKGRKHAFYSTPYLVEPPSTPQLYAPEDNYKWVGYVNSTQLEWEFADNVNYPTSGRTIIGSQGGDAAQRVAIDRLRLYAIIEDPDNYEFDGDYREDGLNVRAAELFYNEVTGNPSLDVPPPETQYGTGMPQSGAEDLNTPVAIVYWDIYPTQADDPNPQPTDVYAADLDEIAYNFWVHGKNDDTSAPGAWNATGHWGYFGPSPLSYPVPRILKIDRDPPASIDVTEPVADTLVKGEVWVRGTFDGSGQPGNYNSEVDHVEYWDVDDGWVDIGRETSGSWSFPWSTTFDDIPPYVNGGLGNPYQGYFLLQTRVVDGAGNTTPLFDDTTPADNLGTRRFVIDNAPPVANITSANGRSITNNKVGFPAGTTSVTFRGAIYDAAIAGYVSNSFKQYKIEYGVGSKPSGDADGWTLIYESTTAINPAADLPAWDIGPTGANLSEGTYTIKVTAEDTAGNKNGINQTGQTNYFELSLDQTNPSSNITWPYTDTSNNKWINTTLHGTALDLLNAPGRAVRYEEDDTSITHAGQAIEYGHSNVAGQPRLDTFGTWNLLGSANINYSDYQARVSSTANDVAMCTFTGKSVTLIATRSTAGKADVFIKRGSGTFSWIKEIDFYSSSPAYQKDLFSRSFAEEDEYTLAIVVKSGTVNIDAIDIYPGSGVDKVDVKIQNKTPGSPEFDKYWTGSGWSAAWNDAYWRSATINSGQYTSYVTDWSLPVGAIGNYQTLLITPRATDNAGNVQTNTQGETVILDANGPVTTNVNGPNYINGSEQWFVNRPGEGLTEPDIILAINDDLNASSGARYLYYAWTYQNVGTFPTSGVNFWDEQIPKYSFQHNLDVDETPLNKGFPGDGRWRLWAYSVDAAGNIGSKTVKFDLNRDTVPPNSLSITSPAADGNTNASFNVGGSVTDPNPSGSTGSGIHHNELRVRRNDGLYYSGSGNTWTPTETWFSVGGSTTWSYTFNLSTTGVIDGSTQFTFRSYDKAGNLSGLSGVRTMFIDRKPPETTATVSPAADPVTGWRNTATSMWLNLYDPDPGTGVKDSYWKMTWATFTYGVLGAEQSYPGMGGFIGYPPSVGVDANLSGRFTLTYYSRDQLDNKQADQVYVFYKDQIQPQSAITAPQNGEYRRQSVTVSGTATDPAPGSGVAREEVAVKRYMETSPDVYDWRYWNGSLTDPAWSVDPVAGSWLTAPFDNILGTWETSWNTAALDEGVPVFPDGEYSLVARAVDIAGCAQALSYPERFITVDNTAPVVTSVSPVDSEGLVPTTASAIAYFNEKMLHSTIDTRFGGSSMSLLDETGLAVPLSQVFYVEEGLSFSAVWSLASPSDTLQRGKNYTAVVKTTATDLAGNPLAVFHPEPPPANPPQSAIGQETWTAIGYTGAGWAMNPVVEPGAKGGYYKSSGDADDTATVSFTGTSIAWITAKGPDRGIAHVTLRDSLNAIVQETDVDLYDAAEIWKYTGYSRTGLAQGDYTLEVKVTGTTSGTDDLIDIDAFEGNISSTWSFITAGIDAQIWQPESGSRIYGQVPIFGQATGESFKQYKMQYAANAGPDAGNFHDFGAAHNQSEVSEIWPAQTNWSLGAAGGSAPDVVEKSEQTNDPLKYVDDEYSAYFSGDDVDISKPGSIRLSSDNSVWHYRKSLTITNNGNTELTGYQIRVPVSYVTGDKMRSDFEDIRFTDASGQGFLPHWKESYSPGSQAVFWVRVPSVPAKTGGVPGQATVFLYYGNPDAQTRTSNGFNVFDRFDDFNDGSINAIWNSTGVSGSTTESGGKVSMTCDAYYSNDWPDARRLSLKSLPDGDFVARVTISDYSWSGSTMGGMAARVTDPNSYLFGYEQSSVQKLRLTQPARVSLASSDNISQPKFLYITKNGANMNFKVSTTSYTGEEIMPYIATDSPSTIALFAQEWVTGIASPGTTYLPAVKFDDFMVYKYSGSGFVDQVTVSELSAGDDASNPIAAGYKRKGSMYSAVFDNEADRSWGFVKWNQIAPPGTRVTVQARYGNDDNPEDGGGASPGNGWSDWSAPATISTGEQLPYFDGRYVQYKVNLYANDSGDLTPVVEEISFYNGVLETWDTSLVPDGSYTLRLLVSDQFTEPDGDPSDWSTVSPKHAMYSDVVVTVENTTRPESTIDVPANEVVTETSTFTYTGADQTYIVPAGVTSIHVKAWGGGGGGGGTVSSYIGYPGGGAGYTAGDISVTPGQVLTVMAGGGGIKGGNTVSYGGGGSSTNASYGAQGGGRSAVRTGANDILTAGGGGGGGSCYGTTTGEQGGAGGGLLGINGSTQSGRNGYGKGGTQTAGGAGGIGTYTAGSGSLYTGGNAGMYGGGGGGGYYGGGGGAYQSSPSPYTMGGGGGGSGYIGGYGSFAVINGQTIAGSNTNPGNPSDPDRGSAGAGGASNANGTAGQVTISYSYVPESTFFAKGEHSITGTGYDEFPNLGVVEVRVTDNGGVHDGDYWTGPDTNTWTSDPDTWILSDDTEGFAGYRYWEYLWDTTKVPDGDYIIESRATDKAGAEETAPYSVSEIRVDNTLPTGSLDFPTSDSFVSGGIIAVNGAANDPPSDVNFRDYLVEYRRNDSDTWTSLRNTYPVHPYLPAGSRAWNQSTKNDFAVGDTNGTQVNPEGISLPVGAILAKGTKTDSRVDILAFGGRWAATEGGYILEGGTGVADNFITVPNTYERSFSSTGTLSLAPGSILPIGTVLRIGATTNDFRDTTITPAGNWINQGGLYTLSANDLTVNSAFALKGTLTVSALASMDLIGLQDEFDGQIIDTDMWGIYGTGSVTQNNRISVPSPMLSWGNPAMVSKKVFDRQAVRRLEWDYVPQTKTTARDQGPMMGWRNAAAVNYDYPAFAHAVYDSNNGLYIYENGAQTGGSFLTMSPGTTYRFRIDLKATGGATYYYSINGGSTWTTMTPSTASTFTPDILQCGFTAMEAPFTFDRVIVYNAPVSGSTYDSPVYDAGEVVSWNTVGQLRWTEKLPASTDVTLQTRTGSTATAGDRAWTAWSAAVSNPAGQAITSLPGRYIQYRMIFSYTGTGLDTATVGDVTISYTGSSGASQLEYWNTAMLPEGEYSLRLTVRDKAGNTNSSDITSRPVTIDKAKPHAVLNQIGALYKGNYYVRGTHTLTGRADDGFWNPQIPYTITNPSGVDINEKYQVRVPVTYAVGPPSMNADYSDLRFTDAGGNFLNHWVESIGSGNAVVWVQLNALPAGGTTISMSYGEPDAAGQATLEGVMMDGAAPSNPFRRELAATFNDPGPVNASALWHFEEPAYYEPSSGFMATGGAVTDAGGYRVHTFTYTGAPQQINFTSSGNVRVLVVGGGGGGGGTGSGGGGGGYVYNASLPVTAGSQTVTVGGGGPGGAAGTTWPGVNGSKGGNSQFATITAEGGGNGVYHGNNNGGNGGSGGGGALTSSGIMPTGGFGSQGGNGGAGYVNSGWNGNHGGGGGAGGVGIAGGIATTSGNGGPGLANSISGASVTYAGGGAGADVNLGRAATGGAGGGANSVFDGTGLQGTDGLGGGGSGGSYTGSYLAGGRGGHGVVIVSYPLPEAPNYSWADSSANQNKLLLNSGIWPTRDDKILGTHGARFNDYADATYDDYAIRSGFTSFPTSAITAEFWIKTFDSNDGILSYASSASDNNFLIFNSGNLTIHRSPGGSIATEVAVNDNQWHHVAVTWRGSDGQTQLYKDGVLAYSGTLSAGSSMTGGGALVLGQEQDSVGGGFDYSQAFNGYLDEVRISPAVLTSQTIMKDAGIRKTDPAFADPVATPGAPGSTPDGHVFGSFIQYDVKYSGAESGTLVPPGGLSPIFSGDLATWETRRVRDGDYTVALYSIDRANNSATATISARVDNTAPRVTSTEPADASTNVNRDVAPKVNFSEEMASATIDSPLTPETFTLRDTDASLDINGSALYGVNGLLSFATFTQSLPGLAMGDWHEGKITTAATDIAGNPLSIAIEETDAAVTYGPVGHDPHDVAVDPFAVGWMATANASASGGSYNVSETADDWFEFSFTTTATHNKSFTWLGAMASSRGVAQVLIDNTPITDGNYHLPGDADGNNSGVDQYNATTIFQQSLYKKTGLAVGPHTVRVIVTGVKRAAASNDRVDVDAFLLDTDTAWSFRVAGVEAKITSPIDNQRVRGSIAVSGIATGPDSLYKEWKLEYAPHATQSNGETGPWTQIGATHTGIDPDTRVAGGLLDNWDTTGLNGQYALRLTVADISDSIQQDTVVVMVDNTGPTGGVPDLTMFTDDFSYRDAGNWSFGDNQVFAPHPLSGESVLRITGASSLYRRGLTQGGYIRGGVMDPKVGYWKLDEGAGATAADSSPDGNHGTVIGSNPWSASGYLGGAYNGSGNSFIDVPNSASLQNLTGDLTLDFWIYPTNVGTQRLNPIYKDYGGQFGLTIETDGRLSYYHGKARVAGQYYSWAALPAGSVVNNQWQHIVITRDADTRILRAYKNDVLITTSSAYAPETGPSASAEPLRIGYGYTGYFYQGLIDEVRIYDVATDKKEAVGAFTLGHQDEAVFDFQTSVNNSDFQGFLQAYDNQGQQMRWGIRQTASPSNGFALIYWNKDTQTTQTMTLPLAVTVANTWFRVGISVDDGAKPASFSATVTEIGRPANTVTVTKDTMPRGLKWRFYSITTNGVTYLDNYMERKTVNNVLSTKVFNAAGAAFDGLAGISKVEARVDGGVWQAAKLANDIDRIESCDIVGSWNVRSGNSVSSNTTNGQFTEGSGAVNLVKTLTNNADAYFEKPLAVPVNMLNKRLNVDLFVKDLSSLEKVSAVQLWAMETGNAWYVFDTSIPKSELKVGWNKLTLDVTNPPNTNGIPNITAVNKVRIDVDTVTVGTTYAAGEFVVDNWHLTDVDLTDEALGTSNRNIVGDWHFDEGAGMAVSDAANANAGAATGDAYWTNQANARFGASAFYGSGNDYVTAGSSAALKLGVNQTVETWFKYGSAATDWVRLAGKGSGNNRNYGLWLATNGTVKFEIGNGASVPNVTSAATVSDGAWHHIVGTYDGSMLRLYVDGQAQTPTATAITPSVSDADPFTVGFAPGIAGAYLKGTVDEVKVYKNVLTRDQVWQRYAEGQSGSGNSPIEYSGGWQSVTNVAYRGGATKRSFTAGAMAKATFTGSSVTWVGATGPNFGIARVYVDSLSNPIKDGNYHLPGDPAGENSGIDLYSLTSSAQVLLYTRAKDAAGLDFDPAAKHILIIENTGFTNGTSAGALVEADAFQLGDDRKWTYPFNTSGLSSGNHTLDVRAYDIAGNTAGLSSMTFDVDAADPRVAITGPADGIWTNASGLDILGRATDDRGLKHYSLEYGYGSPSALPSQWFPVNSSPKWNTSVSGVAPNNLLGRLSIPYAPLIASSPELALWDRASNEGWGITGATGTNYMSGSYNATTNGTCYINSPAISFAAADASVLRIRMNTANTNTRGELRWRYTYAPFDDWTVGGTQYSYTTAGMSIQLGEGWSGQTSNEPTYSGKKKISWPLGPSGGVFNNKWVDYRLDMTDGQVSGTARTEETNAAVAKSGVWTSESGPDASEGAAVYATAAGSATYTFTGSNVTFLTTKGPNRGVARISVDGTPIVDGDFKLPGDNPNNTYKSGIDLYSPIILGKQASYKVTGLSAVYILSDAWLTTTQAVSTSGLLVAKTSSILPVNTVLRSGTVTDSSDDKNAIGGTWVGSGQLGDQAPFRLIGTRTIVNIPVTLTSQLTIPLGSVFPSGTVFRTGSTLSSSVDPAKFGGSWPNNNNHTLKIEYTGAKNDLSSGARVDVDAFDNEELLNYYPAIIPQAYIAKDASHEFSQQGFYYPGQSFWAGTISGLQIRPSIVTGNAFRIDYLGRELTDGNIALRLSAMDDFGRQSATVKRFVKLDTTAPKCILTSPSNMTVYSTGTGITVSGTASDYNGNSAAGSGVNRIEVRVLSGVNNFQSNASAWQAATWNSPNWSFAVPTLGEGTFGIQARAIDGAGNIRESGTTYVVVDATQPPQPSLRALVDLPNRRVILSWPPIKDDGSGVDYYVLYRNGVPIKEIAPIFYPDGRRIDEVEVSDTTKVLNEEGSKAFRKFYACNAIDREGVGFSAYDGGGNPTGPTLRYAVRAVDIGNPAITTDGLVSNKSATARVVYDNINPNQPGSAAVSMAGLTNTATISWAPVDGAAEYRVYRAKGAGNHTFVCDVDNSTNVIGVCDVSDPGSGGTTATKFFDPDLEWGETYYYKIIAFDEQLNFSDPATAVSNAGNPDDPYGVLVAEEPSDFSDALPHLAYSTSPTQCALCHRAHAGKGENQITEEYEAKLCFSCHDGTASNTPSKAEFDFSPSGAHRVRDELYPSGKLSCIDCHNPHLNTQKAFFDNFDEDIQFNVNEIGQPTTLKPTLPDIGPDGWTLEGGDWAIYGPDPTLAVLRQSSAAGVTQAKRDTRIPDIASTGGYFSVQVKLTTAGQVYLSVAGDGSAKNGILATMSWDGTTPADDNDHNAAFVVDGGTNSDSIPFAYYPTRQYRIKFNITADRIVTGMLTSVEKSDYPDGRDNLSDMTVARIKLVAEPGDFIGSWYGFGTDGATADFDVAKVNNLGMLATRYRAFSQGTANYSIPEDRILTEAFCLSCHGTENDAPGGRQMQYYTSAHNPLLGGMVGQIFDQDNITNGDLVRTNPASITPRWQEIRDAWKDLRTNPEYVLSNGKTIGELLKNTSNACLYCHGYHGMQFYYRTKKGEEELCYNCHGKVANKSRDGWNIYQQYNGYVQESSKFLKYKEEDDWLTEEGPDYAEDKVKYAIGAAISPAWFNQAWTYRSLVTLSAAVSDYEAKVVVTKNANMNAGYTDLRFTAADGITELPYWIEPGKTNTSQALVWVRTPAASSASFYMYYGNTAATSTSDMASTFHFGDDFLGAALDAGWSKGLTGGTVSVTNGEVIVNQTGTSGTTSITRAFPEMQTGFVVESKMRFPTLSRQRLNLLTLAGADATDAGSNYGYFIYSSPAYWSAYWASAWISTTAHLYTSTDNLINQGYVKTEGAGTSYYWKSMNYANINYVNADPLVFSRNRTSTKTLAQYRQMTFWGAENANSDWYIDWVRVRSYAADSTGKETPPTATVGSPVPANPSVSFTFTGDTCSFASTRGEGRGIAEVYIDNILQDTIDLSLPSGYEYNKTVFTKDLINGQHTLVIVAKSGRVDIDAVQGGANGSRHGITMRGTQIKCTSCHGQRAMTDRHIYEGYSSSIIVNPANIKQYWSEMRSKNMSINDYCNVCHTQPKSKGQVLDEKHSATTIVPYTVKYPPLVTTTSANGFDRTGYTLGDMYVIQDDVIKNMIKYPVEAWQTATDELYDGGTAVYSSTEGAYMEYSFVGTHVEVWSVFGPDKGVARIMVDGKSPVEINLYEAIPSTAPQRIFRKSNMAIAPHRVTVTVTGIPGTVGGGTRVDVDCFKYTVPRVGHYLYAPQGPTTRILSIDEDRIHMTVADALIGQIETNNVLTIDFGNTPHYEQQVKVTHVNGDYITLATPIENEHGGDCTVSNTTKANCAGSCHDNLPAYIRDSQEARTKITCVTCHHPHATENARLLRWPDDAKTGEIITEGLCLHCHNGSVLYGY